MEKTIWLKILPILFLVATFEHCYAILSHFDGGLNFPVVTTVLLVLAIDISIYFSMRWIRLLPARIILLLSGIISVALNVKYMLDWKPGGTFALIIAVIVGILVPLMLCLFGWLVQSLEQEIPNWKQEGNHAAIINFHLEKYPDKSNREIAEMVGCSHTTISRYRKAFTTENE